MSGERVRVAGDPVTHIVTWWSDGWGYTRCGLGFAPSEASFQAGNLPQGRIVQDECNCMTCLVREGRIVGLKLFDEESR